MMQRAALVALGAAVASAENGGVRMITDAHGIAGAPEAPPRYDCFAEYDVWQTAWTPDWKAWCCKNELRGCPSTTTTTATSSTSTQTTTTRTSTSTETTTTTEGMGCDAICELDSLNATCGERIRWVTTHDDKDKKKPCAAARALVLWECDICGGCSLKAAGCESEEEEHKEERQDRTFMFRKYELTGRSTTESAASRGAPLGFLAGCSLAGLVAGVPMAMVLRRRHAVSPRQAELDEQLYEQAAELGEEATMDATE